MISRVKKLEALGNFTKLVGDDSVLAYLMGFLTGQVDRVHFVRDPTGADISLMLSRSVLQSGRVSLSELMSAESLCHIR